MNQTIIVAGIGAMALILVAVINGYVAKKVAATTAAIAATSAKMTSLELRVDGRLTEILDLTRRVTRAETLNEQK